MIYFDNAATTFPKPQCVYDGINYAMHEYSFNAGRGSYEGAKKTFLMIEDTRQKLANIVKTTKENVIFTSSATESLNNIIYGLDLKEEDVVFVSPFEHNAVLRTLNNCNVQIKLIPFNKETWELKESEFNDLVVLYKPKAIIISHISNVTGYELPYEKIFSVAKKYNAITVLDAAQSYGIITINKNNIDFIIFDGHKSLYAMFGIAGYVMLTSISLKKVRVGGTGSDSLNLLMPSEKPYAYEAGSFNAIGIYSISCGLDFLSNNNIINKIKQLTKYFLEKIVDFPSIHTYLPNDYLPIGIVSFYIDGFSSNEIGSILEETSDICVRTGYHCAGYVHEFIESYKSQGTVRVSFGWFNTEKEIDQLLEVLSEIM